jgi:cell division protein FtsX
MPMVISSSLSSGTTSPLYVLGYNSSNISITAQRDVAAYSDIRHKKDIETIQGSLDTINNIRGVTFYSKEESGSRRMGVIAQELEPYLPEIVTTDKSGYKTVKYANLTALLIQGMKEQQEQIEELKKEIEEIKNG